CSSDLSKPVPGYTNIIIGEAGSGNDDAVGELGGGLLGDVRDGLVVDELIGVGQGNVIGGAFSHPVALAYRVERGEITGRVKDAAVAGNAYELLKRIGGVGTDGRRYGARHTPPPLGEGGAVARRPRALFPPPPPRARSAAPFPPSRDRR